MSAGIANTVKPVDTAQAYFSVADMHAYYGESYIVQGVSFSLQEGESWLCLGATGPARRRP